MGAEIRDAIESVRADLRQVESTLRLELQIQLQRFGEELREEIREEFRRETREEGSLTRRHFDMVAESLRDDIRLIAEGLVTLDAKVEAMRGSVH